MHGPWGGRRCRERCLKMRGGAIRIMLGGNDTIGEGKGGVGREMAGWGGGRECWLRNGGSMYYVVKVGSI